ncbi:hypothetical protein PIB30_111697 [Stylosanthes scabra]|uniref:Uncharacterized protein n=1 Tax=Stylosanthes scabra TaxID=79078 RepID=A0ABU6R0S7_9FABA|nr:hypothetical protein [Stylosanthes scabra]
MCRPVYLNEVGAQLKVHVDFHDHSESKNSAWEDGGKELPHDEAVHPPPVSWRRKPLFGFGLSRKQTSRSLTQHWRRCRGTLCQTLLMAEPQVNNGQSAQMQDGRTTSDSGLNNGRRNGRSDSPKTFSSYIKELLRQVDRIK